MISIVNPRAALFVSILAGVLVAVGSAQANVYCVAEPACVGTNEGAGGEGLQKALTDAASHTNSGGPDSVKVGPGSYARSEGFNYVGDAIAIQGAGKGVTTLTRSSTTGPVMYLEAVAGPVASLVNLTIKLPTGSEPTGLGLYEGLVEGVAIESPPQGETATGMSIGGGTFTHGSIQVANGTGIDDRGGEVLYSSIEGGAYGVQASTKAMLRGDRITAGGYAVLSYFCSPLIIEDSLIDMQGTASYGVAVVANVNGTAAATLRQLTIVNGAKGTGLKVEADKQNVSTELSDSIIAGVERPILVVADGAGKTATVGTDYSSYEAGKDVTAAGEGASTPALPSDGHPVSLTPAFLAPGLGADLLSSEGWRLQASSPLIDAGTPGALGAGEFATDVNGNPRVVGGRRDVGAFEYQRVPPLASATATPLSVTAGQPITFSGSASAQEPGDAIVGESWSFDDGSSAATATVSHAFTTAGVHTATLTATDSIGLTASTAITVDVSAPLEIVGKQLPPLPPISGLRLSPSAFRAARSRASASKVHVGSKVSYSLSEPVPVGFTVERVLAGVRHGSSCLAPRGGQRGKHCTRHVKLRGGFSRPAGETGANSFSFSGRLSGHPLAPGRYVLMAAAKSASGQAQVSAAFQIVR